MTTITDDTYHKEMDELLTKLGFLLHKKSVLERTYIHKIFGKEQTLLFDQLNFRFGLYIKGHYVDEQFITGYDERTFMEWLRSPIPRNSTELAVVKLLKRYHSIGT